MNSEPQLEQTDALNGWKEIASHLGRSARSAQRWERALGLPVHRIPTPDGGSIVYALRSELDTWRRKEDALHDAEPTPSAGGPPAQHAAGADASVPPGGRLGRLLYAPVPAWAAVLLAGVSVATAVAIASVSRPRLLNGRTRPGPAN